MLYVSSVELENFRCFESVTIEANHSEGEAPWTLLTGDNASGKTTLLKAIALGLCDRSSAAGLLRESDSGYIRDGQKTSRIKIQLTERDKGSARDDLSIETLLSRSNSHFEVLDQITRPVDFPWEEIFVCGYGAGRGTSGTGDIAGYSAISAVYNLFNYSEGLQNPELTIRRLQQGSSRQQDVLDTLRRFLQLSRLRLSENGSSNAGISVTDPRGVDVALRDLADGYKSTFLWVTDFLGWALAAKGESRTPLEGIVVIDEIEQHLHPKWQRRIVKDLREAWPKVQFFAATHSPLVARSFQSLSGDGPHRHYHLSNSDEHQPVEANEVRTLAGSRTDQVLASEAFDFVVDYDPDAQEILAELSSLVGDELLTEAQRKRAQELFDIVTTIESMRAGQSAPERYAALWADLIKRSALNDLEAELEGLGSDQN